MTETIIEQPIEKDLKESYLDYAMSVIVGRAIPDLRDGLKPVHRRILYSMKELGNHYNKAYKKSARIVGECFVKDTLVATKRGLIPIQEIECGDVVFTKNGENKVTELYEMPERELLKITLKNGTSNTVTQSQKLKILNKNLEFEWKEAKDITVGDYIVSRAIYPVIEKEVYMGELYGRKIHLNQNIGYLLGQLLSDGWIEKGYNHGKGFRCAVSTNSYEVAQRLAAILQNEFQYEPTIEEREYEIETASGQILINRMFTVRVNRVEINDFLVSAFSLQNAVAFTKIIPPQIFRSPKSVIFSFISGLIDGDGSIHKERNVIHYGSVSEKLIDQLQIVLQHLGIFGKKYTDYSEKKSSVNGQLVKGNYPFHSLEIGGRFAQVLLQQLLLSDERKNSRSDFTNHIIKTSLFDEIPHAGNILFEELSKNHVGAGWYSDKAGQKFRMGIKYSNGTKIRYAKDLKEKYLGRTQLVEWGIQEKLNRIESAFAPFVNQVIKNEIYFLRVEKIENRPAEKTYDIQVEESHEFIANGMISHNCLGKFHPHGDQAVYDSLARMAQSFSLRYMLVDGQGNFGSIDGDSPAAMRYTEVRMAHLTEEMLNDLDKETVDFVPNFDGTLKEPTVLPSKVPNLLINGSAGIAVGMATNIPPHNLTEIVDGAIAVIDGANEEQLLQIVTGPDFPTGGEIVGKAGIYSAYKTGRGIIKMRGRCEIDETKHVIVIREIPYQVTKTSIIEAIANAARDKRIVGIKGVHDRSDREGINVVIDLSRDATPAVVLNQMYAHTPLESTFGIINLVLVNNEPKILGLHQLISQFIDFRKEIVQRRCTYELRIAEERAHILEGLLKALEQIEPIIAFLKASKDVEEAKGGLMNSYSLSEKQAQAILDMKLQRLISLEQKKIQDEHGELQKQITWLKDVLSDVLKILAIIKEELTEIKARYGDGRRTAISEGGEDITIEELIPNDEVVVVITQRGYIKRIRTDEYRSQRRGGKGVIGTETKEEDVVNDLIVTKNHNYILFFTDKGRAFWLKAYRVPEAGRYATGKTIVNLLELKDEKISSWVSVAAFNEDEYLVMMTKNGTIKRTSLANFNNPRKTGIIAITLKEGDGLVDVRKTNGKETILIATRNGQSIRFHEEDAREIGRTGQGVIGIRMDPTDYVVSLAICNKQTVLTITENGYGKRTHIDEYRIQGRGGSGIINMKTEGRNGAIVATRCVSDDDEVILMTTGGQAIRMPVSDISVIGRNTQGVRVIKLNEQEKVASFAVVHKENGEKPAETTHASSV